MRLLNKRNEESAMIIKTAERIKELREKNNLTQSDLARRLNITRSSVNAWEMGISIPSTERIVELCLLLHTTADYLLGLEQGELLPIDQYNADEKELLHLLIQYYDRVKSYRLSNCSAEKGEESAEQIEKEEVFK